MAVVVSKFYLDQRDQVNAEGTTMDMSLCTFRIEIRLFVSVLKQWSRLEFVETGLCPCVRKTLHCIVTTDIKEYGRK
jgi:hypothetical protein